MHVIFAFIIFGKEENFTINQAGLSSFRIVYDSKIGTGRLNRKRVVFVIYLYYRLIIIIIHFQLCFLCRESDL